MTKQLSPVNVTSVLNLRVTYTSKTMLSIQIDSVTYGGGKFLALSYTGSQSGSGNGISWNTLEDLQLALGGTINVNSEGGVLLLFVAWWLALNPALDNEGLVIGKTMTVDLTTSAIVTVS